jgi:hypothetical protein
MSTPAGVILGFQMVQLSVTLFIINHPIFFLKKKHLWNFGIWRGMRRSVDPSEESVGDMPYSTPQNMLFQVFWFLMTGLMIIPVFLTFRQAFTDVYNPALHFLPYLLHYIFFFVFLIFWWSWANVMYAWRDINGSGGAANDSGVMAGLFFLVASFIFWTAVVAQFCFHFFLPAGASVHSVTTNPGYSWTAFAFYIVSFVAFAIFTIWVFATRNGLGGGWKDVTTFYEGAKRRIKQMGTVRAGYGMYGRRKDW